MRCVWAFSEGFMEGFRGFGENMSALVNSILLSAVYLLGVGMTSLYMRLKGKKFLEMDKGKRGQSHWVELNLGGKGLDDHYKMF